MISLLCFLLFAAAVAMLVRWRSNAAIAAFKERWPPISEEEFVRRCSPGVDRECALKARRIISDQLGVDYDRIYPEQDFAEDLGCA